MRISKTQYITAIAASVALLAIDSAFVHSPLLGLPALVALVALLSLRAAQYVQADPRAPIGTRDLLVGTVALASAWGVLAAIAYYLYRFDVLTMWALAIVTAGAAAFLPGPSFELKRPDLEGRARWSTLVAALVMLTSLFAAATVLYSSGTTEAIASPWSVVNPRFLPLLGIAAVAAAALALRRDGRPYAAAGAAAVLALGLSVAAFAYPLGYGFDPFVHEAAIREVTATGTVLPKTPYYVGAYVQIVSVERLGEIPLHWLMRFAGPIAGAMSLAAAASIVAMLAGSALLPIALLLSVLAPVGHFVMTTPQGIADGLALLAVALALVAASRGRDFVPAYVAALSSALTHPIAGVPALGLVAAAHLGSAYRLSNRRWLEAAAALAAIASFPTFAFLAQGTIGVSFDPAGGLARLSALAVAALRLPEASSLSSGRTLIYALRVIFPFLLVGSAWYGARRTGGDRRSKSWILAAAFASAIGGAAFAFLLALQGTIAEEALVFPLRFVSLAGIFLFPLALLAWLEAARRLAVTVRGRATLAVALALIVPVAIYLAYPRTDPEDLSKGYNVSAATVSAMDLIDGLDKGDHVVLGNQTDAAAEIWRRGFSRYYDGEFFVANQAGAPGLYAYYLRAVEGQVTRDLMDEAMARYGVPEAFLVVHDYWHGSAQAIAEAQATADASYEIDGGKVWVFEYKR